MNMSEKSQNSLFDTNSFTVKDYLEIFWRRKWWFVLPVLMGTVIAMVYSYSLPPLYRSSTLILVEPQKVPQSYVSPTVTTTVEDRLNTISQQILSRTNLRKIIEEYGLYKQKAHNVTGLEAVAERLRKKFKEILVSLGIGTPTQSTSWDPERYVDRMRDAIEIKVMGRRDRKNAFTIAYSGTDPQTVMNVTNALASLFIEENLKVRERQAEGTSEFLTSELEASEKKLRKLEERLKSFKEAHRGALPEQLDANLRTLDRLQLELQTVDKSLRNAEEQKIFYEQQLETNEPVVEEAVQPELTPDPLVVEIEAAKRELARLKSQFNDNYPDIVILKKRVSDLQEVLRDEPVTNTQAAVTSNGDQKERIITARINSLNSEINNLRKRRQNVLDYIHDYEMRVEQTYDNELKLLTLTRDYGISKANYEALLSKRLNAKMSENLEKRQKGEQFKVLDPANLPRKPYMPNRPKIIFLGSLLSGAVGVGFIFVVEYINPYFRKAEDFLGTVDAPVLVTIPYGMRKKSASLVSINDPDSVITEQYRVLYAKLTDLYKESGKKVFAVSSSLPGEGKTVTALNLAVVMARDFGKKTLLLEGDFRSPSISRYLKTELESGLVDILLNKKVIRSTLIPFADTLIPFAHDNLSVLPAVKSVRNSSGLLSSQRMRDLLDILKAQYDFILIDAPAVLPLSDMQVFAEVVDGIVLLVRAEKTPREALVKAVSTLEDEKLVGIVLNDVHQSLPGTPRYSFAKV